MQHSAATIFTGICTHEIGAARGQGQDWRRLVISMGSSWGTLARSSGLLKLLLLVVVFMEDDASEEYSSWQEAKLVHDGLPLLWRSVPSLEIVASSSSSPSSSPVCFLGDVFPWITLVGCKQPSPSSS